MAKAEQITVVARNQMNPSLPVISIVVKFALEESKSIDQNLKMLHETIISILLQNYVNLEILVESDCSFWQEYVKFAAKSRSYDNVVTYIELPKPNGYETLKKFINGEYVLFIHSGETLTHSGYITGALQNLSANSDIGLVFANYSVLELASGNIGKAEKLSLIDTLPADSWTKFPGEWLFFNYDKAWCMPGVTIFRRKLLMDYIDESNGVNKFLFLRMLPETNVAFFNQTVAVCRGSLDDGTGKLNLGFCEASLEYMDLAAVDALIAGFEKDNVEYLRTIMINEFFSDVINVGSKNDALLRELYGVAQKHGIVKILYEAMVQAFCRR